MSEGQRPAGRGDSVTSISKDGPARRDVGSQPSGTPEEAAIEQAARLFRALGDAARLRLLARLATGPAYVSELAAAEQVSIAVMSQRLRVLRADDVVRRRRDGKQMLYYLADQHMLDLIVNGLAHASERAGGRPSRALGADKEWQMADTHTIHENHPHEHGKDCGHTAIKHDGHTDYLHDGHLHHMHEGHVDEHTIEVSGTNPADCTNGHDCGGHDAQHVHGEDCGHPAVPHGDHVDYLVDGHLHHQEKGHCDNHGTIEVVQ